MAEEVLAGRVGLREATNVSAYSEALIEKTHSYQDEWDSLSEKERADRAAEGEKYLEEQQREIDQERTGYSGETPRSGSSSRHSGSNWSLY